MKIKVYSVLTLAIIFLIPVVAKAETMNTDLGAWAVVDSNGSVINIEVCSESICGTNGEWQGKVPYCDTCKYVFQLPAETNGNVAGFKDIQYEQTTNTFYANDTKIINGVKVDYPECNSLSDVSNKTKCTVSNQVTVKENTETVKTVTTFGQYKQFSKVVKKIKPKKLKKKYKKKIELPIKIEKKRR